MSPRTPLLIVALAAVTALAVGGAVAPAETGSAAAVKITPTGVGGVKIGRTFSNLRNRGLVGPIRPGCELAPNTRSARLRAGVQGQANFTQSTPRRVTDMAIRGGAKARGVGIGARIPRIRSAFPRARIDRSQEDVFQLTLVKTPRRPSGARIIFGVSTQTGRTTIIGVPFIAFCE